ncbi:MAG: hydrogenase maturation nickel metallochaperone HypA [Stellaceae bacterium]
MHSTLWVCQRGKGMHAVPRSGDHVVSVSSDARPKSTMHELALSQSIVDLVVECARQERVHAVTRVVVEIGIAAGVEPDALRFCFDIVAADTLAQGAELAIESITLRARCRNCACEFEPARLASCCPYCGSYASLLLRGREFRVKSFDGE